MIFNDMSNREINITFLENQIELDRILNDYLIESDILSLGIFTEDEEEAVPEQKENGFITFVKRTTDAILNMLKNLGNAIASLFNGKEHMSTDDFLASNTGQTFYVSDIEAINKECDEKILEGRKMIQAISRGTNIDDHTVAKFVDGAANFTSKYGKKAVEAGVIVALAPKIRNAIADKFKLVKSNEDISLRGDASELHKFNTHNNPDNAKKEKISKVLHAMSKYVNGFVSKGTEYYNTVKKLGKKNNKK